jgi:hypothetical protein
MLADSELISLIKLLVLGDGSLLVVNKVSDLDGGSLTSLMLASTLDLCRESLN